MNKRSVFLLIFSVCLAASFGWANPDPNLTPTPEPTPTPIPTPTPTPSPAPTIDKVVQVSTGLDVRWIDNSSTETGVLIYRSLSPTESFEYLETAETDATHYIDTTALENTVYYYRVQYAYANEQYSYISEIRAGVRLNITVTSSP